MAPGIHGADDAWTENVLSRCYLYFVGTPIHTSNALAYLAAFEPSVALKFLRFLNSQTSFFVGNRNVPPDITRRLFGTTSHICAPERNSYADIDRVEQETVAHLERAGDNFCLVVLAMGCAGRVLQKRVLRSGYNAFLFDFGSLLDALCGWRTRAWMDLAPYDMRELLERL
jgi:hypothetical protein